ARRATSPQLQKAAPGSEGRRDRHLRAGDRRRGEAVSGTQPADARWSGRSGDARCALSPWRRDSTGRRHAAAHAELRYSEARRSDRRGPDGGEPIVTACTRPGSIDTAVARTLVWLRAGRLSAFAAAAHVAAARAAAGAR